MNILGINAYHGDVSAVLLGRGEVVVAVEEERFRRVKHWAGFPAAAIGECVEIAGVQAADISHFAVSRDPRAHLLRKGLYAFRSRPSRGLVCDRFRNRQRLVSFPETIAHTLVLEPTFVRQRMHWVEHHPAHLASAFYVSPFEEAAVCAIDGFGDFVSTSVAVGRASRLDIVYRTFFPHSLGLLYLAITQYLGFWKYGDEYKVMGLAPYGEPDRAADIRRLVRLRPGGRFELDLRYFTHHSSSAATMTWDDGEPVLGPVFSPELERLLGPARKSTDPIDHSHEAIAASLQLVFEECALHVLRAAYQKTKIDRLCLAGGCAMNSVLNGKIREQTPFREVYIQPAAGDNGTALGAAYYVWHSVLKKPRQFVMNHAYWGNEFGRPEITAALHRRSEELDVQMCTIRAVEDLDELCKQTAAHVADGNVVGWYQGRMEWGARALGNRSIVADPRRPDMRDIINTKIKFRERFRPFAPSVLEEAVHDYFVGAVADPFMIQVYPVRPEKRHVIPAVTHVDGSGRLQTVSRHSNPRYWNLIKEFERLTGVPVVLNTSFNENEPIVCKPEEAIECFLRTNMDVLVLGDFIVTKPQATEPTAVAARGAVSAI